MNDTQFAALVAQVQQLSPLERLRLLQVVASSLQDDLTPQASLSDAEWHAALLATYGILADDPIERPPQLPLEVRDEIE